MKTLAKDHVCNRYVIGEKRASGPEKSWKLLKVYCYFLLFKSTLYSCCSESAGRGWRLLIIITAYIKCTERFEPYLVHFLQSTASDPKREFHGKQSILFNCIEKNSLLLY